MLPNTLAAEYDLNIRNKGFCPYFSRVGTLSGDSLARQGEIKREFQTIACERQNIGCPSKSIIHMQLVSTYFDEARKSFMDYRSTDLLLFPLFNTKQP